MIFTSVTSPVQLMVATSLTLPETCARIADSGYAGSTLRMSFDSWTLLSTCIGSISRCGTCITLAYIMAMTLANVDLSLTITAADAT